MNMLRKTVGAVVISAAVFAPIMSTHVFAAGAASEQQATAQLIKQLGDIKSLTANFHSNIKLEGEMIFEIVDQNNEVVFNRQLTNSKEENFTVDLAKGDYQVRWNSTNAIGSYFLEWKQDK